MEESDLKREKTCFKQVEAKWEFSWDLPDPFHNMWPLMGQISYNIKNASHVLHNNCAFQGV